MNQIKRIENFLQYLPKKDIELATKFIIKRDFESLQELVQSSIIKVRKDNINIIHKEEYSNINIENLNILQLEVDSYLTLINLHDENE